MEVEAAGHLGRPLLLLCEPNVSEGRAPAVLSELARAIQAVESVRLIHRSADPDHHRAVFAFFGEPEAVLEGIVALAEQVFERVDMTTHSGEHPRLGALDVVPFVPLSDGSHTAALDVCSRFGDWVGSRGIPVYYYEDAATRESRRALPAIRRGGYEGLSERLADAEWTPDAGPAAFHARAGAVIAGVRGPLVRMNIDLDTRDVEVARAIARTVRTSGGGLPHLRALGVLMKSRGRAQVTMNLTRHTVTGIAAAIAAVEGEAARHGVAVAGTEFIGPLPLEALVRASAVSLDAPRLETSQVLEGQLLAYTAERTSRRTP